MIQPSMRSQRRLVSKAYTVHRCAFEKNNVLWQVCHNTLFFQKILCCASCPQHNRIMCCGKFVTTHYFLSHNTFFSKNIVLCAMSATQYFFEKITCCDRLATTHYFFKKYYVADMTHNTIFFEEIVCCGSKK